MKILVSILAGAVPSMTVVSAFIAKTTDEHYFVMVSPNHTKYWTRFKREYSNSVELAQKRGAKVAITACPEFPTRKTLLSWLADVLSLSDGRRKLLYISGLC